MLSILFGILGCFFAKGDICDFVNSGKITWTGSPEVIYLNGTDVVGTNSIPDGAEYDNLVLRYTDVDAANTLTVADTVKASASILVVGGGGAGGSGGATENYNYRGVGGGGGAGGYLYEASVALPGGGYSITVGKGGEAAAAASTSVGGNGYSSIFKSDDDSLSYEAFGGGGGGAESVGVGGANLGSGGGGSCAYRNVQKDGGVVASGQGNNGGAGKMGKTAGGGGGAGGAGSDGSSGDIGGAGGVGLPFDITGETLYYAGGGGGGTRQCSKEANLGAGGLGGGGRGAGNTSYPPKSGDPNTGGGGGGGSLTVAGANGGSGVVIVRITQIAETIPPPPQVVVEINGTAIEYATASDGKTRTAEVAAGTTAEVIRVLVGGVDVTVGYRIAVEGTTATVVLREPYERRRVEGNAPYHENEDGETVTLNVAVVPGLYYATDSAATIEALKCPGAAEPTKAGDAVAVPKQTGAQGFYKVWVSDAPITAE